MNASRVPWRYTVCRDVHGIWDERGSRVKAEGYAVRRASASSKAMGLAIWGSKPLSGTWHYIRQGSVWPWEVAREDVGTREAVRLAAACEMMMVYRTGDMYLYSVCRYPVYARACTLLYTCPQLRIS
jgi:hypothetical protein